MSVTSQILRFRITYTGSTGYLAVFYFIYEKFADNFSKIRNFFGESYSIPGVIILV